MRKIHHYIGKWFNGEKLIDDFLFSFHFHTIFSRAQADWVQISTGKTEWDPSYFSEGGHQPVSDRPVHSTLKFKHNFKNLK